MPQLDEAFEKIEELILPTISMMLDTLMDAAAEGQPGSEAHAAELRTIGLQLETLTRQIETITAMPALNAEYQAANAAWSRNISA